jgi:hypothetical protein
MRKEDTGKPQHSDIGTNAGVRKGDVALRESAGAGGVLPGGHPMWPDVGKQAPESAGRGSEGRRQLRFRGSVLWIVNEEVDSEPGFVMLCD